MNPLLKAAAESVDFGWVLGGMTLLFLAIFLTWTWIAYAPKNKERWEQAANLPFIDGGDREQG